VGELRRGKCSGGNLAGIQSMGAALTAMEDSLEMEWSRKQRVGVAALDRAPPATTA